MENDLLGNTAKIVYEHIKSGQDRHLSIMLASKLTGIDYAYLSDTVKELEQNTKSIGHSLTIKINNKSNRFVLSELPAAYQIIHFNKKAAENLVAYINENKHLLKEGI